jgi:hypothetical protein
MPFASRTVIPMIVIVAVAAIGQVPSAHADALQAAACSRGLSPEAMIIYQATAPKVSPGTSLYSVLKPTVMSLVRGHQVQKGSAHASAVAAGACLKQLE